MTLRPHLTMRMWAVTITKNSSPSSGHKHGSQQAAALLVCEHEADCGRLHAATRLLVLAPLTARGGLLLHEECAPRKRLQTTCKQKVFATRRILTNDKSMRLLFGAAGARLFFKFLDSVLIVTAGDDVSSMHAHDHKSGGVLRIPTRLEVRLRTRHAAA